MTERDWIGEARAQKTEDDRRLFLSKYLDEIIQHAKAEGAREAIARCAQMVNDWHAKAITSREESGRIRRTIHEATGAEERCLVRAEVWDKCADELASALQTAPDYTLAGSLAPTLEGQEPTLPVIK